MGKLSALWVALLGLGLSSGPAGADGTWSMLEGRWSGMGTIALESGATERLKCQATYLVEAEGHIAQRLTCVSPSYRIEGSTDLVFEGERVSGTWNETSYAVGGGLSGTAAGGRITFRLDAPTFSGNAAIEVQRCRQTVRVTLDGTIIKGIDAGLRRC